MNSDVPDVPGPDYRPMRLVIELAADELVAMAGALLTNGFRLALVAAHDADAALALRIVYLFTSGSPDCRVELHVEVRRANPQIPTLAHLSFPAGRFEREMRDLFGIEPIGHPHPRRLVLHQHWPEHWYPMRADAGVTPRMVDNADPYPFVEVGGPGVYEIPVGPVHAGVIEPGHFRFSVVGETIVKMKARLWFVHKGIERLFEGQQTGAGVALAERISGDSAIAHSLAYVMAVEEARGIDVPTRARQLRAVLLELERLYNHVADVGALCNDVGFGLADAHALTLRERLLRLNAEVTGHRLLRGAIVPGGVQLRRLPRHDELNEISAQFDAIVDLARSNTIVMERFSGTALLGVRQAEEIGVLGVVARASGLLLDARAAHPFIDQPPWFSPARRQSGDVLARFLVRCDEVTMSLALLGDYVAVEGPLSAFVSDHLAKTGGQGTGIVEGWRGSVVHRVEVGSDARLSRVKIVDPSFLTWPALPVVLTDTIVPDFPLVNKSFNLSYAGNDL